MNLPLSAFVRALAGILVIPCVHAAPYTWDASGAAPPDDGGGNPRIRNRRRGFTLTELLVVIAIVAVLAAILFGITRQVMASARKAGCINNIRQVGAGMLDYGFEFGGFPPARPEKRDYRNWAYVLHSQYGIGESAFLCPADKEVTKRFEAVDEAIPMEYSCQYVAYGYNGYHLGSNWEYGGTEDPPARATSVRRPSETIMLIDHKNYGIPSGGSWFMAYDHPAGKIRPAARHGGSLNILWADGHASSMKIADPENPYKELGVRKDEDSYWDR